MCSPSGARSTVAATRSVIGARSNSPTHTSGVEPILPTHANVSIASGTATKCSPPSEVVVGGESVRLGAREAVEPGNVPPVHSVPVDGRDEAIESRMAIPTAGPPGVHALGEVAPARPASCPTDRLDLEAGAVGVRRDRASGLHPRRALRPARMSHRDRVEIGVFRGASHGDLQVRTEWSLTTLH